MHPQFAAQSCLRAAVHCMQAVRLCWGPNRYCSCHGISLGIGCIGRGTMRITGKDRWLMGTIAADTARRSHFRT